jgi:hypothetical protein
MNPSVYIVVASQPQDCVSGIWSFPITAVNSGTGGAATTTTTTAPNLLGIPLIKHPS